MKSLYKSFILLLTACFLPMLQSCKDDIDLSYGAPGSLEGDCRVSFNLQGMPLQTAMTRSDGKAIKSVRNLYVLFYTLDDVNGVAGELAYAFTSDENCANDVFDTSLAIESTTDEDRNSFNPGSDGWSGSAEAKTQKVKTNSVMVGRGQYHIYVVANVDDFSKAGFSAEDINTPAKLKKYNLTWNSADIKSNDAMFGYFTTSSETGYDALDNKEPVITLSTNDTSLHAWMKRAASKVTVAFDGSNLYDNVNVYIKKVSIKDIPANCNLGSENKPGSLEELISTGEQVVYNSSVGISNETRVSRREPYFPDFSGYTENEEDVNAWREKVHSETYNALYFFENCQGVSTTNSSDADGSWKAQTDTNGNGIPDDAEKGVLKDTKSFGTYIEVEAYYTNDNFQSQTKGNIIYRFMLGMNTTNDFNARRNNHYKLTLCFKNNANDADWHIDYSDEPGVYIPDIIYVSYTYNTPSKLPIRIVGHEVSDLSVTINSSNWYPDDSSIPYFTGTTDPTGLPTGFLSLSYDENPRVGRQDENFGDGDQLKVTQYWQSGNPANMTRTYIDSYGNKVTQSDLDSHGYKVNKRVTSEGETVYEADIPLFTRPLVMYKWTAWTGANPYYSSERSAQITLNYKLNGVAQSKKIQVKQVRRIENPAGIYRRHDNSAPFDVVLMERAGEGGQHSVPISYSPLVSHGAWRAIVYRTTTGTTSSSNNSDTEAWFTLSAGSQRVRNQGAYIQGDADSKIEFTYAPNGTIARNEVRTGIIKVEYNDYTCTHYIFVRQGYAPMQLEDGRVYWHTFNLYSGNEEVTNPCEAGSLFIRGYFSPAILDSNTAPWGQSVETLSAFTNDAGTTTGNVRIPIDNKDSYLRKDFDASNRTLGRNNTTLTPFNTGRMPKMNEWSTLLNEVANAQVDRAYGVLYADGATTTQQSPENVFGCLHSDVASGTNGNTIKGMRGTFVYNTGSGRNLFFPIGSTGYGRRKVGSGGELQYGFGDTFWSTPLSQAKRAPLYNLYTNEGAIYWSQNRLYVSGQPGFGTVQYVNAWDINYKSYDFDFMDEASNGTASAYIRLVQDSAP